MHSPRMTSQPSRSWLTRLSLLREKDKFSRLIARERCPFRVSLLAAILGPASINQGKWSIREVNISNSSKGTSIRLLVSTSSRCKLNSNSSNTRITRHLVRWFKLHSRIRTVQLKGLALLVLVSSVIKWVI